MDTNLAFTKYCFTSKALLWESIILLLPPLPATPILLQYYCMTFAQYAPPNRPPPLACHTPYTIGDGNIVKRPNTNTSHTTANPTTQVRWTQNGIFHPGLTPADVGLYKIFVYFNAFVNEPIIISCPPHL